MDSSRKPDKPRPDADQPSPAPVTDGNATIRTPDGDVTIRTPGSTAPGFLRAWDATVRGHNRQQAEPEMDATVRLSGTRGSRLGSASNLVKPALAALALALLVGAAGYAYLLDSKLALETMERKQVQAALDQAATLALVMKKELVQAREELDGAKQRLSGMAALQDRVVQRETEIEQLSAQLGEKERELVALYKKASPKDEILAMLQSATVRTISLSGVDTAKSAGGLILYDTARDRAYLYAFNLPALPPGKVYQLWAGTKKPVSAGTFKVDTGRKGRLLIRNLPPRSGTTKFTVSVEPEGGRPQPTGAVVLRGSL